MVCFCGVVDFGFYLSFGGVLGFILVFKEVVVVFFVIFIVLVVFYVFCLFRRIGVYVIVGGCGEFGL